MVIATSIARMIVRHPGGIERFDKGFSLRNFMEA